jgi:uncharacterized protein
LYYEILSGGKAKRGITNPAQRGRGLLVNIVEVKFFIFAIMKGDRIYLAALLKAKRKVFDKKEVYLMLQKAYNLGNSKAAYAIGSWYFNGQYVKKNIVEAVKYFKEAAAQNEPNACFDLAICLEKGKGIKKNSKKSFEYYMKAALAGDKQSFYEVGRCYFYGIGTPKNKDIAWLWLDKAKNLGIKK